MSAVPAYTHYPERSFEQDTRTRISVVPGRGIRTQNPVLPSRTVFFVKVAVAALVAITLVAFVRIGLSTAATSASIQASELSMQIDEARSLGASLEVSQSVLSNPSEVKERAKKLGMSNPESTTTINLDADVVTTDSKGALSLSKSVSVASGSKG